jgi:hypothetical protein
MPDANEYGRSTRAPGRGISTSPAQEDDSLIHAIGDVGQTVDRLQISVERQIRELTEYVNQCERNHQEDMGHWRTVTEELAQLLKVKAQSTQAVSSSYMQLAEHLAKFSKYLTMSEMTLSRVEQPLLSFLNAAPSLSDGSMTEGTNLWQTQELLQAFSEVKTTHQQLKAELRQTLVQIASSQRKSETSIWTDLANWKAALVWFAMGSVFVAGMMYTVFRGSGFQQAMRAMQLQGGMVDARLERIEIWLGIEDDTDGTADFEGRPIPKE